ncbi:hypothetical protein AWN90_09230 [Nocardia terpenica]|uniref:PE-PPE domain-containing protein n=2 Tax=Nocardia terpenica TaxID=455432 RepID=A0A164H152_9NOCA|nr:hypothetical protein AWN90_09230 [Nocardia terpenica]
MLRGVTRQLDPARYVIGPDVDYPASVGPANHTADVLGCSEDESVVAGLAALATAVRATPDLVGLLGYSLGAEVVTRFLEAKARGEYPDCTIAWAATVANPLRREGDSIDSNEFGYGINGQHSAYPADIQTWEAANPADAITSSPADSPLRQLADGVSALTFANLSWTTDLADRFNRNRWQPGNPGWWMHPFATARTWGQAAAGIRGYLDQTAHIRTYIQDGYLDRLAARINAWQPR